MTERTEPRETICAVAQDIMPLMLDNVCSPESRSFVEEHVRNCEDCREALALMQAEDRQTPSPEEATKNRAQWKGVRRYCKRLTSRGFLLGLAATVLLAALAAFGVQKLWLEEETPIPSREYDLTLARTEDGWVAELFSTGPYDGRRAYTYDEEGVLRMEYTTSRLPKREAPRTELGHGYYFYAGALYRAQIAVSLDEGACIELGQEIREIRLGTAEDYRVVYRAGDEIPLCSAEEEEEIRAHMQRTARADGEIPWDGMEIRRAEEEKIS